MCDAYSKGEQPVRKVLNFCSRDPQSSLLTDLPGSLVGGVRSWDELPKEESCFSWSSLFLGFRLKKVFNFSVLLLRPGLELVGEVASTFACNMDGSSTTSFC